MYTLVSVFLLVLTLAVGCGKPPRYVEPVQDEPEPTSSSEYYDWDLAYQHPVDLSGTWDIITVGPEDAQVFVEGSYIKFPQDGDYDSGTAHGRVTGVGPCNAFQMDFSYIDDTLAFPGNPGDGFTLMTCSLDTDMSQVEPWMSQILYGTSTVTFENDGRGGEKNLVVIRDDATDLLMILRRPTN